MGEIGGRYGGDGRADENSSRDRSLHLPAHPPPTHPASTDQELKDIGDGGDTILDFDRFLQESLPTNVLHLQSQQLLGIPVELFQMTHLEVTPTVLEPAAGRHPPSSAPPPRSPHPPPRRCRPPPPRRLPPSTQPLAAGRYLTCHTTPSLSSPARWVS